MVAVACSPLFQGGQLPGGECQATREAGLDDLVSDLACSLGTLGLERAVQQLDGQQERQGRARSHRAGGHATTATAGTLSSGVAITLATATRSRRTRTMPRPSTARCRGATPSLPELDGRHGQQPIHQKRPDHRGDLIRTESQREIKTVPERGVGGTGSHQGRDRAFTHSIRSRRCRWALSAVCSSTITTHEAPGPP